MLPDVHAASDVVNLFENSTVNTGSGVSSPSHCNSLVVKERKRLVRKRGPPKDNRHQPAEITDTGDGIEAFKIRKATELERLLRIEAEARLHQLEKEENKRIKAQHRALQRTSPRTRPPLFGKWVKRPPIRRPDWISGQSTAQVSREPSVSIDRGADFIPSVGQRNKPQQPFRWTSPDDDRQAIKTAEEKQMVFLPDVRCYDERDLTNQPPAIFKL